MQFLEALRDASEGLKKEIKDSKLFGHPGLRGGAREVAIKSLLRPHLPEAYGLGSGQVFDHSGTSSKQLDVVIYDALFGNVLFRHESASLFCCQNVYGAIEVKSLLDTRELDRAIENSISLKMLGREDATGASITPVSELKLGNGLEWTGGKMNHYFHVIFAYSSISAEQIILTLNSRLNSHANMISDFIWVYDQGLFILPIYFDGRGKAKYSTLNTPRERYACKFTSDDTVTMMVLTLNVLLAQIRLKAPNYNEYWKLAMNGLSKGSSSL